MIDAVKLSTSSLFDDLAAWLRNPVVRLEMISSQEVAALQLQVQDLMAELEKAKHENEVLMARYTNELSINFVLQDTLKEHHIKWR